MASLVRGKWRVGWCPVPPRSSNYLPIAAAAFLAKALAAADRARPVRAQSRPPGRPFLRPAIPQRPGREATEVEREGIDLARSVAADVGREIAIKRAQLAALATSQALRDGDYMTFHAQAATR